MSLESRSISFTRYRLVGSRAHETEYNQRFRSRQLPVVKLGSHGQEWVFGWDYPPIDQDAQHLHGDYWDLSNCHTDEGYLLRMRVEHQQVPSRLLQILYKQRCISAEHELKKHLTPEEQKNIRDTLEKELLSQALPMIRYVDSYWNPTQNLLYVYTTTQNALDLFCKLFQETFWYRDDQQLSLFKPLHFARNAEKNFATDKESLVILDKMIPTIPV